MSVAAFVLVSNATTELAKGYLGQSGLEVIKFATESFGSTSMSLLARVTRHEFRVDRESGSELGLGSCNSLRI